MGCIQFIALFGMLAVALVLLYCLDPFLVWVVGAGVVATIAVAVHYSKKDKDNRK